jgi:transposase
MEVFNYMGLAKTRKMLILSEKDRNRLSSIVHSRTESYANVQRARIMLSYAMNESISSIAQKEKVSRPTVQLCIDKALAGGIEAGLIDLYRTGRPHEISIEAKSWVVSLACSKPTDYGYAAERWTLEKLAEHVRNNASKQGYPCLSEVLKGQISRILQEQPIKPHKIDYYLERKDPEFETKMAQVLIVYKEIQKINDELHLNPKMKRTTTTIS